MSGHTTDSAETLAWDNVFKRAINLGIDDFRMGRKSNDGLAQSVADAVLASDWMKRHDAEVRAEAWDEGANAAVKLHNAGTRMTLRAVIPFPENPYRIAGGSDE